MARYYEAKEGLFLAVDPEPGEANDPISQHAYAYVQNNPVMLDDPDGEHPLVAVAVYVGGRYVIKYVAKNGVKYAAKKYKGKLKVKRYVTNKKPGLNGKKIVEFTIEKMENLINKEDMILAVEQG